jgi:hypothetical protein
MNSRKSLIKNALSFALIALVTIGLTSWNPPSGVQVEIGDPVPLFQKEMVDINGAPTFLRQEMKMNGLLVVFSCNTCPFVLQWEDRYNEIYDLCAANEIGMVLVNSNEAKRTGDDSLEKMKEKATAEGYKMPYLMDEGHLVADAFGARTTPHVFMFDKNAMLAYRGSIDDNSEDEDQVTQHYLKDAINAMSKDEAIEPNITKSIGCSIKRVKQ